MINFPPVNITTASRTSSLQKTKRKVYVTESEQEKSYKSFQQDRRSSRHRRHYTLDARIVDRRVGYERRKGRVNIVV
jgi:hypothetical protein